MQLDKISLTQLAAVVGAVGTIVGAGFTIDARYAKRSDIDEIKKELRVSLDTLHKQILENEQLKQELGNSAQAAKILTERNRKELAEIRERLNMERISKKRESRPPPPPEENGTVAKPGTVDR